jgi:hypothetical protein
MNLIDRVKNILVSPKEEWPKIAAETATTQSLYTGYIMILAAIGPVAITIRMMTQGIVGTFISYLIALFMVAVIAWVVDALAPTFGGERNFVQSLKLTAYSCTAVWLAGILHLFGFLVGIVSLIALIYSLYTFYLGVTVLKKCPQEKAVTYTVVVVLCLIVAAAIVGSVFRSTLYSGAPMGV